MKIILHWVLISISVFVTSKVISGVIIDPLYTVLIVGACLTLFSMFIKPIINVLTLPINMITLGLFSLVINGAVFWFLGNFIKGFSVETFTAAFVGALLVAILNWILNKVFHFDI